MKSLRSSASQELLINEHGSISHSSIDYTPWLMHCLHLREKPWKGRLNE
jgi:hypothetical protein